MPRRQRKPATASTKKRPPKRIAYLNGAELERMATGLNEIAQLAYMLEQMFNVAQPGESPERSLNEICPGLAFIAGSINGQADDLSDLIGRAEDRERQCAP